MTAVSHSLRNRLTLWYSLLLVMTVVVLSAAVLWLHWHLVLDQFDDALGSISATAANVVEEELQEHNDLRTAASEMAELVRAPAGVVQVLDHEGRPILNGRSLLVPAHLTDRHVRRIAETVTGDKGRRWRVSVRRGNNSGQEFFVLVASPLDEAYEQWQMLLRACLIGIPIALSLAIAGGFWLGRLGLRPLATMASEAQAITSTTPDKRLTVPASSTELEQFASSFNRVLNSLATALSTQRRFMADASHELRTPITVMRTAAEVTLSQPTRDEAEYRDALAVVAQQSSRLTRLVGDMLVLARADGGGYPVVMAPVDLMGVVQDCIRDLDARAEDNGIAIDANLEPIVLKGDEALLRRMFSNLLANALAYTPRGGSVSVSLAHTNREIVLQVADTGPGIAAEDRERVFERFVRLDPARASGGAGLGLSIVRWVAEAHGGVARIASSGPGGSVFAVVLPA